ncbi:MAG: phosphatidate cytidylyltransferase [Lachnospiraceae bacterium]|nr:phosphatidate cytidylyltransferase [Lachnospiraceae bacterium]
MVVRLISGIVLLAILFFVIISGGPVLGIFTMLISLLAYRELTGACGVRAKEKKVCLMEIVGFAGIIVYDALMFLMPEAFQTYGLLCIILTIMGMMLVYVLSFPAYDAKQVMASVFAFVYAPLLLSYIYQTRTLAGGQYTVWLIFCASWACDTCAYAVGMLIGKHKLAPVLSPKKSIEGAVGGVVGAALVGWIYAFCLQKAGVIAASDVRLWAYPLISGAGGILSQIGDLAASGIKRNYDIKDYAKLIPGHGGIMDRFDSVIAVAPLIYYLSLLLLK